MSPRTRTKIYDAIVIIYDNSKTMYKCQLHVFTTTYFNCEYNCDRDQIECEFEFQNAIEQLVKLNHFENVNAFTTFIRNYVKVWSVYHEREMMFDEFIEDMVHCYETWILSI